MISTRISLHPLEAEILACLYQHRLLTTPQVQRMVAADHSEQWVRKLMRRLGPEGRALATWVRPSSMDAYHRTRLQVWFLTERGTQVAESDGLGAEARRRQLTPDLAGGALQRHTLAVNEAGLAFAEAARQRGHDCGPWHWRHEWPVLWPDVGRGLPIADGWLRYRMGDEMLERFIEVDRLTAPDYVAAEKLARYAELWRDESRWSTVYPSGFPEVVMVLTGAGQEELRERMAMLMKAVRKQDDERGGPGLSVVMLDRLRLEGPWARIFLRLNGEPHWADWLGAT